MTQVLGAGAIWSSLAGSEESKVISEMNRMLPGTIHQSLGIEFTAIGDAYLEAKMPVDHRTINPLGILHGGASVVLAESLGSVASVLVLGAFGKGQAQAKGDAPRVGVGLEVSASHLSSVPCSKPGEPPAFVVGRVTLVKLGKSFHFWDIVIRDGTASQERVVCKARLTVFCKG